MYYITTRISGVADLIPVETKDIHEARAIYKNWKIEIQVPEDYVHLCDEKGVILYYSQKDIL